ncbi:MAG: hypothetical protein ABI601_16905 [bacterium]
MPSHQMAAAQLSTTPRQVTELRAEVPHTAKCDRRAMALAEMDSLRADYGPRAFESHYTFGAIHAALGNKEAAFAQLDSAITKRDWMLFQIKRDPALESLHSDPRFAVLVRKMGLVP